ncbi:rod shape-determining protein RodA [Patescibacteria group bacterium]|nr:rod shape-determining protein RodA [Patescibacteria group bacterium]
MRRQFFDPWIIGSIIVLLLFSLIVLRSVLPGEIGQQLLFVILGVVAFLFLSQIDYRILSELSRFFYGVAVVLLVATLIFGQATRGSVRWLEIGPLTIQPSEFIKPVMILFLATFVHTRSLRRGRNLMLYVLFTALPVLLVFKQPDLGSALVLSIIGLSIAFTAGIPLMLFGLVLGGTTLSLPLIFQFLKPYQQDRLLAFIDPFADPLGSGYNVIQSMIAVGAGKLFGRGLGHGTQSQLRFLPERHSDFIYASLAEELGFIGAGLVLASYFVLLYRLFSSIKEDCEPLGSHILVGILSMFMFQVTVNIGMNIGLLPITGITLPLISSGGSSMLATMISLGIAQSVVGRNKSRQTIEIR